MVRFYFKGLFFFLREGPNWSNKRKSSKNSHYYTMLGMLGLRLRNFVIQVRIRASGVWCLVSVRRTGTERQNGPEYGEFA